MISLLDKMRHNKQQTNVIRKNTFITIVFHLFGPFCAVLASKFAKSDNERQKFNIDLKTLNSMLISNSLKQLQKSLPQKSYRRNHYHTAIEVKKIHLTLLFRS